MTVLVSWVISFVLITDTIPAYTTVLIVFTPAVVVLTVRRVQGYSFRQTVTVSLQGTTVRSVLFAVGYPILFIGVAAVIALTSGLGTY